MSSASNPATAPASSAEASPVAPPPPPFAVGAAGGRGGRFARMLALALALAVTPASCGIPSYPFLAPPVSAYAYEASRTFSFGNNPDTSPIFDGFVVLYRIYERKADLDADLAALGTLDPELDGVASKLKLEQIGFKALQPELAIDPAYYDASFVVDILFSDTGAVTASATSILSPTALVRSNAEDFSAISPGDEDVKEAPASETPDDQYSVAILVCARGFDLVSINPYYSQFVKFSPPSITLPVSTEP